MPSTKRARAAARDIKARGLKHAAVTAMFSPLDAHDEDYAAEILLESPEYPSPGPTFLEALPA